MQYLKLCLSHDRLLRNLRLPRHTFGAHRLFWLLVLTLVHISARNGYVVLFCRGGQSWALFILMYTFVFVAEDVLINSYADNQKYRNMLQVYMQLRCTDNSITALIH